MSRKTGIRWNENQTQRLNRAVKNFNAKIKRLEKKDPDIKKMLPDKVLVAQLKKQIQTSRDLENMINSLQRFSRRGAEEIVDVPTNEYNLKTTKWQKEEMVIMTRSVNLRRKNRKKDVEDVELELHGKKLGYTQGDLGMGSIDKNALKPIKPFTRTMTRAELKAKYEVLRNESQYYYWKKRDLMLVNNYIDTFLENFGETKRSLRLANKLRKMDFKEFYLIFRKDPNKFETLYPLTKEQKEEYLTELESLWT